LFFGVECFTGALPCHPAWRERANAGSANAISTASTISLLERLVTVRVTPSWDVPDNQEQLTLNAEG